MTATQTAITVTDVTKRYGDFEAVRELSFAVERGEVYGFLGPNGAGKTTTIHMLLSLVEPTDGTLWLFGESPAKAVRSRIGVLSAHADLYDNLTAREHIEFVGRTKETDTDPDNLCERVGLGDAIDQQTGEFSTGMAQRLKLAMALVGDPELLVLDEPTSGLDPNGARRMREIIQTENDEGTTVFFSSHILQQVEAVCDRVGILSDGRLVVEDTIDGLRERTQDQTQMTLTLDGGIDRALKTVTDLAVVEEVGHEGDTLELSLTDPDAPADIVTELGTVDCTIESFETDKPSLEDLFSLYTTEA